MRYYIERLPMTIPMGVQSENNAEAVEFDVSVWLARDGSLSFSVWVTRPGETEAYQAANATLKDGILYWWPTGADTAIAGEGRVEILAVSENRRMLSGWTATSIRETTTETTTDAPVDQRPWLDQALLASEEAKAAATSAAASADQAEGVVKKEIAALTEDIARNTAPPIIPTATGDIITITDGAARPAVELISHIEPMETGTGEKGPNNPWAISGRNSAAVYATGKNLLGAAQFVSRQGQPNDAAVGTDRIILTSPTINETGRFSGIIVPMVVGETVTFSMKEIVSNGNTIANMYYEFLDAPPEYAYNGGTDFTTARYFTATATKPWLIINLWWVADATNGIAIVEPQLEVGNAATAFEAIKEAKSLTATLPETVYGGDMYWLTGVLENYGHKLVIDGTNIAVAKHESANGVYVIYNIGAYGHPLPAGGGMIACSHFPAGEVDANSFHVTPNNNGTLYLGSIPGISEAAAYNAWLANNPITCVYRVADPTEIQLTPQQLDTLKGTNNVWSDCGDTTLSYVADTELWATQKFAAIAAAMLAN